MPPHAPPHPNKKKEKKKITYGLRTKSWSDQQIEIKIYYFKDTFWLSYLRNGQQALAPSLNERRGSQKIPGNFSPNRHVYGLFFQALLPPIGKINKSRIMQISEIWGIGFYPLFHIYIDERAQERFKVKMQISSTVWKLNSGKPIFPHFSGFA